MDFGRNWESVPCEGFDDIYQINYVGGTSLVGIAYTGLQPHGTYGIIHSDDNGSTWTRTNVSFPVWSIRFFDPLNGYCDGAGSGIYRTADGGVTWDSLVLPFTVKSYAFQSLDIGWIVDDTGLIHYTTDGAKTFIKSNCGKDFPSRIHPISDTTAYGVFRTTVAPGKNRWSVKTFDLNNIVDCPPPDSDLDGYPDSLDCSAQDPAIHPGAIEIPNNGIDEDCDGHDLITSSSGLEKNISVYPNPAHDVLYIDTKLQLDLNVRLFDFVGRSVPAVLSNSTISLSHLPPGGYALEITDGESGQFTVQKIIVY
jgi:hypothetical protein